MKVTWLAAVIMALASASTSAWAGTIQIAEPASETSSTWSVTITGITNPNLTISSATSEGISFTYNAGRPATGNQSFSGVLFEDSTFSAISDFITVSAQQGVSVITITVSSDAEQGLTIPPNVTTRLAENGTFQTLGTVQFDGSTDTIQLQSDVAVPEPATLTLLGIGIASMAGYGWRRRKPAAA
jgi:hypothetical protein